ncbi:MAG: preprotein translocase subunit SecE [Pseudomonadota bacterium]
MPKSKNKRKSKGQKTSSQPAANAVIEATSTAGAGKAERSEAASSAKKSVGPVTFFQQVRAEAQKVTWTSRGETMVSTIMVLIMVAIMSLFFFSVDQLLRWVVPSLLSLNLF